MNKVVLVLVLLVGMSGESMFGKNIINVKNVNYLNSIQVAKYEKLAKKIVKKLKVQGLTDEHIIDAFMHEFAANEEGADDDTLLRSPRLLLAIGGILVAGILVCVIANALKCRNITGSCRVVFPDNYSLTSQEQQAYSQLTTELQGNRLACDQDWDNFNHSVAQFANQLENVYFSSIRFSSTDQVVIGVSERSS